uniref:Uncharacterized protein n=1 Tax=Rhizophora mucronata TaxID=61149 RepID=A0A2P2NAE4_RHIMU
MRKKKNLLFYHY